MLNARSWLLLGTAAVLVVVIVAVTRFNREPSPPSATLDADSDPHAASDSSEPNIEAAAEVTPSTAPGSPGMPQAVSASPVEAAEDGMAFRVSAAGDLVVDERMRLNMEALIARTEPQALDAAVREQTEELPPAARRAAEDLVQKFINYQQAQRQADPPDGAPLTSEDAVRQLEALHALRVAHFGPEVAQQLFGREEAIAREMIDVMRVENDQSLTPQEKRERAEALRERLPTIGAIERSNRESAARPEQ